MNFELYRGDCLEVLPTLEADSVDLICIDPPYNIKKADWDTWKNGADYIEFMGRTFLELQRVMKDNGSMYWFHNDMPTIVNLMAWLETNTEFIYKQFIAVNKKDKSFIKELYGSQNHFRNYINIAEYCLFYTFQDETGLSKIFSEKDCFQPIKKYMRNERDKVIKREGFRTIEQFNQWVNAITKTSSVASRHYFADSQWTLPTKEMYQRLQSSGLWRREYESLRQEYESLRQEYESLRYTFNKKDGLENVWEYYFKKDKQTKHPTQKPVALIKDIIKYSSNEGDTVLDCFGGSGTTLEASYLLKRNCIIIEKDDTYFKMIEKRYKELKAQPTLL